MAPRRVDENLKLKWYFIYFIYKRMMIWQFLGWGTYVQLLWTNQFIENAKISEKNVLIMAIVYIRLCLHKSFSYITHFLIDFKTKTASNFNTLIKFYVIACILLKFTETKSFSLQVKFYFCTKCQSNRQFINFKANIIVQYAKYILRDSDAIL